MIVEQLYWTSSENWHQIENKGISAKAQLVFAFGDSASWSNPDRLHELRNRFPQADLIGATGSGVIMDVEHFSEGISATAIYFETGSHRLVNGKVQKGTDSALMAKNMAEGLPTQDLKSVLVIASAEALDMADFIKGLTETLSVPVTGVFAGSSLSERAKAGSNKLPAENGATLIGFYGAGLSVFHGHASDCQVAEVPWVLTRNENAPDQLNGQPSLTTINRWYTQAGVGNWKESAPAFLLRQAGTEEPLFLSKVHHDSLSVQYHINAIAEGAEIVPLTNTEEQIVDQAYQAAEQIKGKVAVAGCGLTLVFSNRYRKCFISYLEEELEVIRAIGGEGPVINGFYSFAEFYQKTPADTLALQWPSIVTFTLTEK